jgi:hypothetical protein
LKLSIKNKAISDKLKKSMKNIYLLICLIFSFNIHAQSNALPNGNSVTFKGIVLDSSSTEPIPSANVSFYLNEQLIKRAISDNKGEFKIILPKGNYTFQISCIGFKTKKGITDSTLQNKKGFEIKLSEATNTTSDVVIKLSFNQIRHTLHHNYDKYYLTTGGSLIINPSNYIRGPFLVPR